MIIPFVMFLIGIFLVAIAGICHISPGTDIIYVPIEIRESEQYGSGVVLFFLFVFLCTVLVAVFTRL